MSISVAITGSSGAVSTTVSPGGAPSYPDAPSDGGTYARNSGEWIDLEGAANLQMNRGTATEVSEYTPLEGEPVWDSQNKQLRVGDGETQGGILVGNQTAVSGGLPDNQGSLQIISGTYSTPISVPLTIAGSTWRITGVLRFDAYDPVDADVEIDFGGSGATVVSGQAWIDAPAGASYENWLAGNVQIAIAEGEAAAVQIDYIVTVASATTTFGIPIRRTSGSQAAYLFNDGATLSKLYAQRIA